MMKRVSWAAEHGALWLCLGCAMAVVDPPRRRGWLVAGATAPASIPFNFALKQVVKRPRPEIQVQGVTPLRRSSFSFPSAHATSSFAAATVVRSMETPIGAPAVALAGLVAYSRIHLAKHYPADIVVGGAIGVAFGSWVAARKLPDRDRGSM